jgi:hypothetical protein
METVRRCCLEFSVGGDIRTQASGVAVGDRLSILVVLACVHDEGVVNLKMVRVV